jgi:hypothetical protein
MGAGDTGGNVVFDDDGGGDVVAIVGVGVVVVGCVVLTSCHCRDDVKVHSMPAGGAGRLSRVRTSGSMSSRKKLGMAHDDDFDDEVVLGCCCRCCSNMMTALSARALWLSSVVVVYDEPLQHGVEGGTGPPTTIAYWLSVCRNDWRSHDFILSHWQYLEGGMRASIDQIRPAHYYRTFLQNGPCNHVFLPHEGSSIRKHTVLSLSGGNKQEFDDGVVRKGRDSDEKQMLPR